MYLDGVLHVCGDFDDADRSAHVRCADPFETLLEYMQTTERKSFCLMEMEAEGLPALGPMPEQPHYVWSLMDAHQQRSLGACSNEAHTIQISFRCSFNRGQGLSAQLGSSSSWTPGL